MGFSTTLRRSGDQRVPSGHAPAGLNIIVTWHLDLSDETRATLQLDSSSGRSVLDALAEVLSLAFGAVHLVVRREEEFVDGRQCGCCGTADACCDVHG
jgi:hypothetical protein